MKKCYSLSSTLPALPPTPSRPPSTAKPDLTRKNLCAKIANLARMQARLSWYIAHCRDDLDPKDPARWKRYAFSKTPENNYRYKTITGTGTFA